VFFSQRSNVVTNYAVMIKIKYTEFKLHDFAYTGIFVLCVFTLF